MVPLTRPLLLATTFLLAGCTINIHVHGESKPVVEAPEQTHVYSVTHNTSAAAAHGWEVVGTTGDGRSIVRRPVNYRPLAEKKP